MWYSGDQITTAETQARALRRIGLMLASTSRADRLAQRGCCRALAGRFLAQRGRCGTHRRLGSLLNANPVEQKFRCECKGGAAR